MLLRKLAGFCSLLLLSGGVLSGAVYDDEFVGPFPSWANLKRDYGTGGADLQRALNEVGTAGRPSTLFIPAGSYCVQELSLASRMGITIIGEDPSNTIVKFCGAHANALLKVNGVAYSKISRLTFDCAWNTAIAIDQSWDGKSRFFDTGNEYSDLVFQHCQTAIQGGATAGFAETSVLRSQFGPSDGACIAIKNFNALDLWIWYSKFKQCFIGVTNDPGAGNFHVYNSVFEQSGLADMRIHNTGGFNIRNNTSIGSRSFWVTSGPFRNPATITLQGNTLIDAASPAIVVGNQGPLLLMDNRIQSLAGSGPVVDANRLGDSDVISVGNTFSAHSAETVQGRRLSVDDREGAAVQRAEAELPATPPNLHRRVIEVPAGASEVEIQRAIAAAAAAGNSAIVHLPEATYAIHTTLVIPRGSDLQLTGDGYRATRLKWSGASDGVLLRVLGPSKVAFREINFFGANTGGGIVLEGVDQPQSRVYMQQVQFTESVKTGLFVDGLRCTNLDLRNVNYANIAGTAVKVVGQLNGGDCGGNVDIFSGASSNNSLSYDVSREGRLLVRDVWYETGHPTGFLRLSDDSTFTLHGSRVALPVASALPAAELRNFSGRATFVEDAFDGKIATSGAVGHAKVLGFGLLGGVGIPKYFPDVSPALSATLRASRVAIAGGSSVPVPDQGPFDPQSARQLLEQTRQQQPRVIQDLPPGASDIRFYRVWFERTTNGVLLRP